MDPIGFVEALNDLAVARGIDKMQLVQNFEEALQQAYTRAVEPNKRVEVHLNPETGDLEVLIIKEVVEVVADADKEISKADA